MRINPKISHLFEALEYIIQEEFLQAIIGKSFIYVDLKEILCLPARFGGMVMGDVASTQIGSIRVQLK